MSLPRRSLRDWRDGHGHAVEPALLRADPYERGPSESGMYIRWYGDNLWLFVPVQQKIKELAADFNDFPFQLGASLNVSDLGYKTVMLRDVMQRLTEVETLAMPNT
jgi:hypothetical protein